MGRIVFYSKDIPDNPTEDIHYAVFVVALFDGGSVSIARAREHGVVVAVGAGGATEGSTGGQFLIRNACYTVPSLGVDGEKLLHHVALFQGAQEPLLDFLGSIPFCHGRSAVKFV